MNSLRSLYGTYRNGDVVTFVMEAKTTQPQVLLYDAHSLKLKEQLAFPEENRIGRVYYLDYKVQEQEKLVYCFSENGEILPDTRGKAFLKEGEYGTSKEKADLKANLPTKPYHWGKVLSPKISYQDCFMYLLHVRGFTMDESSNVLEKGTFLGVTKKLSYLKKCGVTSILFQPIYEFLELEKPDITNPLSCERLNYWGYKEGYYFAPKSNYAYTDDPVTECKQMIHSIHKMGMEVILQMYYPGTVDANIVLTSLLFWAEEYRVDGFVLMGENLPKESIQKNPLLADKKLIFEDACENSYGNTASFDYDYYFSMRRFLKGDGWTLRHALFKLQEKYEKKNTIHFLSNFQGFTLADLVSYENKHNEANGENNQDGMNNNESCNYGIEGQTTKKKIVELRLKQVKNALCLMMLGTGTPMLFMGDELGNTQLGNNNPYCQDNEITWLNWKKNRFGKEIFEAFQTIMELRSRFPILRPEKPFRMTDYLACGYPDLSYHGREAWRQPQNPQKGICGILYSGLYGSENTDKQSVYLAINLSDEDAVLALPNLPVGCDWILEYSTEKKDLAFFQQKEKEDCISVPAKTIRVYASEIRKVSCKNKK